MHKVLKKVSEKKKKKKSLCLQNSKTTQIDYAFITPLSRFDVLPFQIFFSFFFFFFLIGHLLLDD